MPEHDSGKVLARPAFAVADHTFSWREVLLAARTWGMWDECERAARDGLASLARANGSSGALGDEELREMERSFRRARGLLSAEELDAWLGRWQLDRRAWREYIHAEALRDRAAPPPPADAEDAARADTLAQATWTRAVCAGTLEQVLERLAGVVAAANARGTTIAGADELDEAGLAELYAQYESFCESALNTRAIEREVELRALDWTLFELCYLAAEDEDVMREAALCVREDGMSIEQVAANAGIAAQRLRAELVSLEEELRSRLLGTRAGTVLGPLIVDGSWRLVQVLERRAPSLSDPALRERAAQVAVDGAVQAEVVNRVQWHERI